MRKILFIAYFSALTLVCGAQGFASFQVEGALTETVIKNPGKNPGMIQVLVGQETDITQLSPKYKLLSGCSLDAPLPKDFTGQVNLTVNKNDGTSKEWIIQVKKLVPSALPLDLNFSESNPSLFSNEAKGWAAVGTDESKPTVVRFGNKDAFFICAFDRPAKQLKFDLNVVGKLEFDGAFVLETSADGKSWKTLDQYADQNRIKNGAYEYALKEEVRYVKWTYTQRNKQNINLNHISIE